MEIRLPGQRQRPEGWTAPPTTPARSWAELIETLQGGLAVLDADSSIRFASERFLPVLGSADDIVGHEIRAVLPALAADDPRRLGAQVERGEVVEFEQQFRVAEDDLCYLVTVVPIPDLGPNATAVVFAKDISESSRTFARLRQATVGLTEIESELHSRAGREVHDGPIQLLAALMFRLGMTESDEGRALEPLVSRVAGLLRNMIAEISPARRPSHKELIEQWIAPLLIDAEITVVVEDDRPTESGLPELQAAFVMLYQVVLGIKYHGGRRNVHMVLSSAAGGDVIRVTFQSARERSISTGPVGAQYRTVVSHARALGGTVTSWIDDDEVRTLSMWIPHHAAPSRGPMAVDLPPANGAASRRPGHTDLDQLPPLDDSSWTRLIAQAPERLVEFDGDMRVSFGNDRQQQLGPSPAQLIGSSLAEVFAADALLELDDTLEHIDRGEITEADWNRQLHGETRLVHLIASPRLASDGSFGGLLVSLDDKADIDLLRDLYRTALADLNLARREAIARSIRLLEEPLAECGRLIEQLSSVGGTQREPLRLLAHELEGSLRRIEGTTSVLVAPLLTLEGLGDELSASLGSLLVGRRLIIVDKTDCSPSAGIVDAIFKIAREAVNNAIIHGAATTITITIDDSGAHVTCEIHDDGTGVDLERLQPRSGHLGTRAMRERASELGGRLEIDLDPRGGTLVRVRIPTISDSNAPFDPSFAGSGSG